MNTISNTPNLKEGQNQASPPSNQSWSKRLIPLIIVLAVIPLIVLLHKYNAGLSDVSWYSFDDTKYDTFLYWKQACLIGICSIMLLIMIYCFIKKRKLLEFKAIFIPILLYLLMAILSTAFSDHISASLKGSVDQFESIFALISYVIACYYAFTFVKTEADVSIIIKALLVAAALLSLLGLTELFGHSLLTTDFAQKIITSTTKEQLISETTMGDNIVYLTFYNPNYVGVYVSLILPLFVTLMIHCKNWKLYIVYGLISVGLIVCLVGSQSKAGIVITSLGMLLVLFFSRKKIFRHKFIFIPAIIVCIGFAGFLLIKLDMVSKLKTAFSFNKTHTTLTAIETNDDNIVIHYNDNQLKVSLFTNNSTMFNLYITDGDDNPVFYTLDQDTLIYAIEDERYPDFYLMPAMYEELLGFQVLIDGNYWFFTNQIGEYDTYFSINWFGKPCKINNVSSGVFDGYESILSGRGFIWSRTLPLLKEHFMLGSGPDTFVYEFPNDDFVGLYNYTHIGQVCTKPHSLYLQMAVQTGFISLIAFLIFYVWYFISSVRLYTRSKLDTYIKQVGAGIFIGTIGYMLMGISNDSSITVAPIFWALLGVGIAINHMLRKQKMKQTL